MKTRIGRSVIFLMVVVLIGCGPKGIKITGKLSASPDPVHYNFAGGAGCGPTTLKFEFFWPIDADYDNRFIPPATVNLNYSLAFPGGLGSPSGSLTMAAPTLISSEPYTATLNIDELASDLSFGGAEITIDFWVDASAKYHASDFDPKATGLWWGRIFESAHRSVKIWPCLPTIPYTLEPGQWTLTPSLTPIPSDTPTPTLTPTPQPSRTPTAIEIPTKKPKSEPPTACGPNGCP